MAIEKRIQNQRHWSGTKCCCCPFFKYEDAYGEGYCDLMDFTTRCYSECNYVYCYEFMTPQRALKVLHLHQKWRRGAKVKMIPPTVIGFAVDEAMRSLRKQIKENGERD